MEVVIDPRGVVAGGKSYPAGTPLAQIRATAGDLAAWRRFKQVGEAHEPAAAAAPDDAQETQQTPVATAPAAVPRSGKKKR